MAALALGPVERQIGAGEQRFGIGAVLRVYGDAHARANIDRPAVKHQRFRHCCDDSLSQRQYFGTVGDARRQKGKLIAAEPHTNVFRSGACQEPTCDCAQHPVPCRMTQGVVDELESVEIDHHQRGAARRRRHSRHARPEYDPVRQPGQAVLMGEPEQPVLVGGAFRDIARHRSRFRALRQAAVPPEPHGAERQHAASNAEGYNSPSARRRAQLQRTQGTRETEYDEQYKRAGEGCLGLNCRQDGVEYGTGQQVGGARAAPGAHAEHLYHRQAAEDHAVERDHAESDYASGPGLARKEGMAGEKTLHFGNLQDCIGGEPSRCGGPPERLTVAKRDHARRN